MKLKKTKSKQDKWFNTFDLGLAAALLSTGQGIQGLNKTNPKEVEFVFKRTDKLDEAIQNYWNDRTTVKAQTYWNNSKRLKNQIYSS